MIISGLPDATEAVVSSTSLLPCSSSDLERVAGTRLRTVEAVGTLWTRVGVDVAERGLATAATSKVESD